MKITSITAWKKALKKGGTLRVVNHQYTEMDSIRPIMRVQGNAFSTQYIRPNGEAVESWFYYPKADQLRLSDDGLTLMLVDLEDEDRRPRISYTVLEGEASDALSR